MDRSKLKIVSTEPTPSGTAAAALRSHRAHIDRLQAQAEEWATKQTEELGHVRAYDEAHIELERLERAHVGAIADEEVLGHTDINVASVTRELEVARAKIVALKKRAVLAQEKLVRIGDQRKAVNDDLKALGSQFRALQHAARLEALAAAMPGLLEAEQEYLAALVRVWALSGVADDCARQPGPVLPLTGILDVRDVCLPRPAHPAFVNEPVPQRGDIAAAIAAEAERLSREV
jgi:CHASE3 domain sensor protein